MKREEGGWYWLLANEAVINYVMYCSTMPSFVGCTVQHIAKWSVYTGQVCISLIQRLLVLVREGVQCCVVCSSATVLQ